MIFGSKLRGLGILLLGVFLGSCNNASDGDQAKGHQMLNLAIDALGGIQAFAEMKSVQNDEVFRIYSEDSQEGGTSTAILIFPDRLYQVYRLETDTSTLVIEGENVWSSISLQNAREKVSPNVAHTLRQAQWFSIVHLFANVARDSSVVSAKYKGTGRFRERTMDVLAIDLPYELGSFELYLDRETQFPAGYEHRGPDSKRYAIHYRTYARVI